MFKEYPMLAEYIFFKCDWNSYQDIPYAGQQNKYE